MTAEEQNLIADGLLELSFQESKKFNNSQEFVDIINSIGVKDRTDKFKNMIIHLMEVEKNEEGYYQDVYGNNISYNGIKTLKREGTKTGWTLLQTSEYAKCSADFEYFFYNYCKIMTKKGYNFPTVRAYQANMLKGMKDHNRLLLSISRQLGKCSHKDTFINIINNETGLEERITVEDFHNRLRSEYESKNRDITKVQI